MVPQLGAHAARAILGRAARGACRLPTACSLLGPAADALSALSATGWWYRCQIPLTMALAMRGMAGEAAAALAALEDHRHPGWRCLDYEYAIARAWVAAAQGAVSQAVATLLSAAETARTNGQFAAEVMCLQTATQFGDHSGASRLGELATIVEGPRAGARPGSAPRWLPATAPHWPRCRRNSSGWAILSRPLMRPRTRRWRIAVKACADRGWDARHERRRWLNDAAPAPPRLVRPVSGCR